MKCSYQVMKISSKHKFQELGRGWHFQWCQIKYKFFHHYSFVGLEHKLRPYLQKSPSPYAMIPLLPVRGRLTLRGLGKYDTQHMDFISNYPVKASDCETDSESPMGEERFWLLSFTIWDANHCKYCERSNVIQQILIYISQNTKYTHQFQTKYYILKMASNPRGRLGSTS